jgi:predicted metalloprotease with PDZ domain
VWTPSPSKSSSPSVQKRATTASTAADLADVFGSTLGVSHPQQIHPTAPAAPAPVPAPGPPSITYDFEPGAIGLSLADHSSGAIVVMEVVDGTVAQQKGVMVGMALLAVNGEKVAGLRKDAAMEIIKRYANTTRRLTFSNERLAARAPAPAPPPPAHDIMQVMLAASSTDNLYGSFSCG